MNFKKLLDVLAWLAIVAIVVAEASGGMFCLELNCSSLIKFVVPVVGFSILLAHCLVRRNFQAAVVMLVLLTLSGMDLASYYENHTRPSPEFPTIKLD